MKFVALALALLLAVGSHAATLQADAPAELTEMRTVMMANVAQFFDGLKKAADQIQTETTKTSVKNALDSTHQWLVGFQSAASTHTDAALHTATEFLTSTNIPSDFEKMRAQVEAHWPNLKGNFQKHFEQYQAKLEGMINEGQPDAQAMMTKVQPHLSELRAMLVTNLAETKAAGAPIAEAIYTMCTETLERVRQFLEPYVQEYKDKASDFDPAEAKATALAAVEEFLTKSIAYIKTLS